MRGRPSPLSWVVLVLILTMVPVGLTGCGSSAETTASPSGAPSAEPSETATGGEVLAWDQAGAHVGEDVTVEGPIVAVYYDKTIEGDPTFMNMGVDYPDRGRCTVIIWGEDLSAFPEAPKGLYDGKAIRVSGEVSEYQKAPAIMVSSPDAIEVVD